MSAASTLAGRQSYVTEEKLAKVEALIAGATSAGQVKANAAAADWTPAEAELAEIDAIVPPPPSA